MLKLRLLYVVSTALLLSACAAVQPIYKRTAINDADDCIATESQVVAPSTTALESAVAFVMRRCDVEIHAAEANYLAQTQGDERPTAVKVAQVRRAQHDLARKLISMARAI
jgi:hypothetical protein